MLFTALDAILASILLQVSPLSGCPINGRSPGLPGVRFRMAQCPLRAHSDRSDVLRTDAGLPSLPTPIAPAASSQFVLLTTRHSASDRSVGLSPKIEGSSTAAPPSPCLHIGLRGTA